MIKLAFNELVRSDKIAVLADGWLVQRIQNLDIGIDSYYEDLTELGASEASTSYIENAVVNIEIDTNEYGSMRHLRMFCGVTGYDTLYVSSFEHACVALMFNRTDNLKLDVKSSLFVPHAYLDSINWSFDVNSHMSEKFSFRGEDFEFFKEDKPVRHFRGFFGTFDLNTHSGYFYIPQVLAGAYSIDSVYLDGIKVTGGLYQQNSVSNIFWSRQGVKIGFVDSGVTRLPFNYKALFDYSFVNNYITKFSTVTRGSLGRGKISAYLSTGVDTLDSNRLLKVQNGSIDLGLNRIDLEEIGNNLSFERPIGDYTIKLDLELHLDNIEIYKNFINVDFETVDTFALQNFISNAAFKIKLYNLNDYDTDRILVKEITVSGLSLISHSLNVNAGGLGGLSLSLNGRELILAGSGIIGYDNDFMPYNTTRSTEGF